MDIIKSIEHEQLKNKIPELKVGNTVRVHVRIKEGNKERIQVFEGIIIKVQGGGVNQTFWNSFRFSFAAFKASSSLSIPINNPFFDNLFNISLLCPAPPRVPSTYIPSDFIFNPSIHSSNITGLCLNSNFSPHKNILILQ